MCEVFKEVGCLYFNPRTPCEVRQCAKCSRRLAACISIHAPRAGCDLDTEKPLVHVDDFNPRTPCGVRRWASRSSDLPRQYFNPRTPCGVRPCAAACRRRRGPDFNPRTPCGVRRWIRLLLPGTTNFNPRAPCGTRRSSRRCATRQHLFQSTRPVWDATFTPQRGRRAPKKISIHAPRVGRDSKFDDFTPSNLHKRYKRVLARPKNTREKGKIKQKLAYIHAFSAFLGCEGSGTFCALVLRTQYR